MTSIFDPDTFMDQEVSEGNSTERLLCPPGVYSASVEEVKFSNGEKEGKEWVMMSLKWSIDDPSVLSELKRDKVTVRQSFFIDLTEDGGISTEKGSNVQLGKVRKALGLNEGRFSPRMLMGQMALVEVVHRAQKDGTLSDEVKSVASLG